jgi:hypothetical protein
MTLDGVRADSGCPRPCESEVPPPRVAAGLSRGPRLGRPARIPWVAAMLALTALVVAPAPPVLAQMNPLAFGTWTLNLAKSVYTLGPPPKAQTQVYQPSGTGVSVSVETITGDGGRIAYGYTANVDGRPYPIEGALTPNGAGTVALATIDAFTTEAILRLADEVVLTIRIQVSRDGRVLTLTSKGTNRNEQPTHSVAVFDKQ